MYLNRISGNVLFLILLAVALFAALSYAVTQSNRSGGNDISDEDARLAASQIIQYATLMEQTVTRLRLSNGCRDTQISFAADSDGDGNWYDADDNYHNPNAPSDFRCHVFHASGGGVSEVSFSDLSTPLSMVYNGGNIIQYSGNVTNCTNGACSELMLILWDVPDLFCAEINKRISGSSVIPEQLTGMFFNVARFVGAYLYSGYVNVPQASYCFDRADADDTNYFYHVLIPR